MSTIEFEKLAESCSVDPPKFHGDLTYRVNWNVIEFLFATLSRDSVTIETGAGLSTLAFASIGCIHTAVIPSAAEAESIRCWLRNHQTADDKLSFDLQLSWDALPAYPTDYIDLAFIDGCHGFPAPFIDFFYFSRMLKVGGILGIDDLQIWTGRTLLDFLSHETSWEVICKLGKTAFLRKLSSVEGSAWEFTNQPYVIALSKPNLTARIAKSVDLCKRGSMHLVRGDFKKVRKGFASLFNGA